MDLLEFYVQQLKWGIIPIKAGAKWPYSGFDLDRWKNERASLQQVREWQRQYPGCSWAAICGKVSNLVVLDVDPKNNGKMPDSLLHIAPSVYTPSGGTHSYFPYEGQRTTDIPPGIDIQSDKVYVLVPPSPGYKLNLSMPELRNYTRHAGELAKILQPKRTSTIIPTQPTPSVVGQGERHYFLLSRAGKLNRHGLSKDLIYQALKEDNANYCKPPVTDARIRKLAYSMNYAPEGLQVDLESLQGDEVELTNPANDLEAWLDKPLPQFYLKTGFEGYDTVPKLWMPGSVHTIGGWRGAGKSFLALHCGLEFLKQDKSVVLFTTEMSKREVYERACLLSGITDKKEFVKTMKDKPFFIYDSFSPTFASVAKIITKHSPNVAIFDYIQHLTPTRGESQTQAVMRFMQGMKNLAREMQITIVLVSQLTRPQRIMSFHTGEQITAPPTLNDMKDSSSIEQESDHVTLIQEVDKNRMQIELAKNRHSPDKPTFFICRQDGKLLQ